MSKARAVAQHLPYLRRYARALTGSQVSGDAYVAATLEDLVERDYILKLPDSSFPGSVEYGFKHNREREAIQKRTRASALKRHHIDLRPVYHRKEERIRSHVVLCWLALLLIRIIETTTGDTWQRLRTELGRLHAVTYTGPAGTFIQRTELTKPQRDIYTALALDPPGKIIGLATPSV